MQLHGFLQTIGQNVVSRLATLTADTELEAYIDFSRYANGAAPTKMDTGQRVDWSLVTNRFPVISNGQLVAGGPFDAGVYADYFQCELGANAIRLGTNYVMPTGAATVDGAMCLAAWASHYAGSGNVPSSRCHLTLTPGVGTDCTAEYGLWDGAGHFVVVATTTFPNLPADGLTVGNVDVQIDETAGNAYVTLPNGVEWVITAAQVTAAWTSIAVAPIALKDLGGSVVMVEHFAAANGNTAKYPQFQKFWASAIKNKPWTRFFSPLHLAKILANYARPTTYQDWSPAGITTSVTTGGMLAVDIANARVFGYCGPTGAAVIDVDSYYVFTGTETVFQRVAPISVPFGGSTATTTIKTAVLGVVGDQVVVRTRHVYTGGVPGSRVGFYLMHSGSPGGNASLKTGGAGGAMLPPLFMSVTPLLT